MMREGHDIAAPDEHMVVKVPHQNGNCACKTLSTEGVRVNVTLVSAAQARSPRRPAPPSSARLAAGSMT
jgi:transaldolase